MLHSITSMGTSLVRGLTTPGVDYFNNLFIDLSLLSFPPSLPILHLSAPDMELAIVPARQLAVQPSRSSFPTQLLTFVKWLVCGHRIK